MSGYKEFEGKTLDEAIQAACSYYDAGREKLEIEIGNDAKGGIFGLVGARKARIRARLVELASVFDGLDASLNGGKKQKKRQNQQGVDEGKARQERKGVDEGKARQEREAPVEENRPVKREESSAGERAESQKKQAVNEYNGSFGVASVAEMFARESSKDGTKPAKPARDAAEPTAKNGRGRDRGKKGRPDRENGKVKRAEPAADLGQADLDQEGEDLKRVPFDQLDPAALESAALEIVTRLTQPFLDKATITVTIGSDRVRVGIADVEDPGLLIGRDGQNLASLQYLVTRMLSNRMKALLRVQIDTGDYCERQDERLRELALSLAEKVKAGGRPQVTRPLSSYHRRVIHLTLQEDPQVQTHSKGEGEMKRVMVTRRK